MHRSLQRVGVCLWAATLAAGCTNGREPVEGGLAFPSERPIGTPCSTEPNGRVEISSPSVDLTAIGEARFNLSRTLGGYVSMGQSVTSASGCGCCTVGRPTLSFALQEMTKTLGTHPVGPDATRVLLWLRDSDEVYADSGTVTFDGYDPDTGSLCGTVVATYADYGTITATFAALDVCP